jgi:hypothetical protein
LGFGEEYIFFWMGALTPNPPPLRAARLCGTIPIAFQKSIGDGYTLYASASLDANAKKYKLHQM